MSEAQGGWWWPCGLVKIGSPAWRKFTHGRRHVLNGLSSQREANTQHDPPVTTSPSPTPDNPTPTPAPLEPLELHGVRTYPAGLFKLRGFFNGHTATLLLDSGASSEFIDPAFARRCGLELQKSNREIKLADGTVSPAAGRVETECLLAAATGQPIPFTAVFTATPLEGYDAILGMTWLEKHNPQIGWAKLKALVEGAALATKALKYS